jgi:hypothetical protein
MVKLVVMHLTLMHQDLRLRSCVSGGRKRNAMQTPPTPEDTESDPIGLSPQHSPSTTLSSIPVNNEKYREREEAQEELTRTLTVNSRDD